MTDMLLYNSLSRRKEAFVPADPSRIGMYVCGPTVYDRAHLGNARAMTAYDLLYRLLRFRYGKDAVCYVRNVTDVDDKINKAAREAGIPIDALTRETTARFHEDMEALGCLTPTEEPRATAHIADMIAVIERLLARGAAYVAEGHVLFSVSSYPDYGRLSNRTMEEMVAGARVEVAPFKRDPQDFVLWKPSGPDEPGWESPWGRGRPGWHIECTAMSGRYLGRDFDIHGGGVDLIFPHHENERAQACAAYPGCGYAGYWVHNGFLTVDGEKMSKSLGNFLSMGDVLPDAGGDRALAGDAVRLALLSAHYRKPLNWHKKLYEDSLKKASFWREIARRHEGGEGKPLPKAVEALSNDLNTPSALAEIHALARKASAEDVQARAELVATLKLMGFLGRLEEDAAPSSVTAEEDAGIERLVALRLEARARKDWAEADRIRRLLDGQGVVVTDLPGGGSEWRRSG
jgi:cysteinyl-tRNA synthetase